MDVSHQFLGVWMHCDSFVAKMYRDQEHTKEVFQYLHDHHQILHCQMKAMQNETGKPVQEKYMMLNEYTYVISKYLSTNNAYVIYDNSQLFVLAAMIGMKLLSL